MRKNVILSVLLGATLFWSAAIATTYVRPYGASDYAGGTKAVGAKVNAEFAALASFLNGGNIATGNIAAFGVEAANIASSAVTTAKIADGAVTNVKRGAANVSVTSSSSLFQRTGSYAQVTNLSTSITTNGRPVMVYLDAGNSSYLVSGTSTLAGFVYSSDPGGPGSFLTIQRDSSTLAKQSIQFGGSTLDRTVPCSAYSKIDNVAAGTYTYSVGTESAGGVTATVAGCRLIVVEF